MVFFFYIVFSSEMQRFLRSIKKRAAVCAFSVISTENPRKPLRVFSFFFTSIRRGFFRSIFIFGGSPDAPP